MCRVDTADHHAASAPVSPSNSPSPQRALEIRTPPKRCKTGAASPSPGALLLRQGTLADQPVLNDNSISHGAEERATAKCVATAAASSSRRAAAVSLDAHNGLRGLMALHVALFHFLLNPHIRLHTFGNAHMPFFFLLSGFSLSVVYGRRGDSGAQVDRSAFWRNRFSRCMPLVYLTHAMLIPAGFLGYGEAHPGEFWAHARNNVFATSMWLLRDNRTHFGWNGPAWTVSSLVLCYWLFPFCDLDALARAGSKLRASAWGRLVFGAACAACTAYGLHAAVAGHRQDALQHGAMTDGCEAVKAFDDALNCTAQRSGEAALLAPVVTGGELAAVLGAALLVGVAAAASTTRVRATRGATSGTIAAIAVLAWLQFAVGIALFWGGLPYVGRGYWVATGWAPTRVPLFLMGCLAGKVAADVGTRESWGAWTDQAAALYVGVLAGLSALCKADTRDALGPFGVGLFAQTVTPCVQLVIMVGLARSDGSRTARVCLSPTAQLLGKISMALYLVHMPVSTWLTALVNGPQEWVPAALAQQGVSREAWSEICEDKGVPTGAHAEACTAWKLARHLPPAWLPLLLALSLGAAYLLEKRVETPMRNLLRAPRRV